jgi:hypothetical protein
MNQHDLDIAWAAGLFEGEGCVTVSVYPNKVKGWHTRQKVELVTTDEDVIRKFAEIVGVGSVHGPRYREGRQKPIWNWRSCRWDDIYYILDLFIDYLGQRRLDQFLKVITIRTDRPYVRSGKYVKLVT